MNDIIRVYGHARSVQRSAAVMVRATGNVTHICAAGLYEITLCGIAGPYTEISGPARGVTCKECLGIAHTVLERLDPETHATIFRQVAGSLDP